MGFPVIAAERPHMPKGSDTEIQGLLDLANAGDKEARGRLLDHAC